MKFNQFLLKPAILQKQIHPLSCGFGARYTCKIAVEVDKDVLQKLEAEELKPRRHPGIVRAGHLAVPTHIIKALVRTIGDHPVKSLVKDGQQFSSYFHARHPPPEVTELRQKIKDIESELNAKKPLPDLSTKSDEEVRKIRASRDALIQKILKQRTFAWKPMVYGTYESLAYAVGRSAQEYGILKTIFTEIASRHENFKPRSYFDFGSGVGTGMWAASEMWRESIFEYFNVDSSKDMNSLSEMITKGGAENKQSFLRNVFYRQFLPAADTKYDLVVSAFTLFELPGEKARKEAILKLWKKCDGYLILVEEGTRAASGLINEARDYIINLEDDAGHVFAPCPHDAPCPRFSDINDKSPCNFAVSYEPMGIGERVSGNKTARYSYVVLKKTPRSEEDNWPRIVRPTLIRSKHSVCRMCTAKGTLQEIIFTKSKHGKFAYRCARSSEWGDRIPIEVGEEYGEKKTKKREEQIEE